MSEAWVNGKAAPLREAVAAAAALLRASRSPVLAGMGTDMVGTRAAILLAEATGAAFDHMHAGHLLADLEVLRSSGAMLTTPNELRLRADAEARFVHYRSQQPGWARAHVERSSSQPGFACHCEHDRR